MESRNPSPLDICTWRPAAFCKSCAVSGSLKCRFAWRDLLRFGGTFMLFAVPAVIGVLVSGHGWFLLGWLAFMMFFFNLWESRILCSHCPFYAEGGRTLHCIANYASFKPWPYHPEPMNTAEKIQLFLGFAILVGYPFPFLILGGQWILGVVAVGGLVVFAGVLISGTCNRCVNFSCPLNRVPKRVVDGYLARNPVMKSAWEANGWAISRPEQNGGS
jgi:hypothetical protein